jgi:hypothetical protein
VILTTNPDNGDYNVTSLDVAQKTRFISVEMKYDVQVWAKWAEKAAIDGRCINFMLMHPELVTQRVNPRSITTFFNGISSIPKFEDELPLVQMITMFINNKLDKMISPEDLLTKDEAYVKGALLASVGEGDDFRADLSSVIATRVINYALTVAENGPVPKAMIDRLAKVTTEFEGFTNDLRYYMVKEIVNGNKVKFSALMADTAVVKMAIQ